MSLLSSAGSPASRRCRTTPQASTSRSAAARCARKVGGLDRRGRCRRGCAPRRRALVRVGRGGGERHHARLAALVDEDVVQLQVEVGDAGVVAEGEAAQHARDPAGRVVGRRRRMLREPLVERHAGAAVDGDVRPVLVDAALGDLGEVGMIEPRRAPRRQKPVADARRAGRRARAASTASPRCRCACRSRARPSSARSCASRRPQGEVAEGARRRRGAEERGDSGRHRGRRSWPDWSVPEPLPMARSTPGK